MGAGSGWVFFSGARVIAPTILSRFESLRALLVVWSLALSLCRNRRRRESVRAARGCAVQWRAHAARWELQCAKGRAEGGVCAACRGDVVGAVFVALAAKATLRGQAADQLSGN